MQTFKIGNTTFCRDNPAFEEALAAIHAAKGRPLCMCQPDGVEMYVAKVHGADSYLVKRMPDSGARHASACESYEPPAELSGLGEVVGSAIQEDPDAGTTTLKLDFALTKTARRAAPIPNGGETDSVRTDGKKLTLRGTLHYLWEEAGFHRWSPKMAGSRNWFIVRKYLLQATDGKVTKGSGLAEILYIPESFRMDLKDAIAQRREARFRHIAAGPQGARHLMLLIGEVKEIAKSRYGHKVIIKHVPDAAFMMADDLHARLLKRFDVELTLWDALETSHLIMIGTFGVSATGVATFEEVALMNVTEHWIPFESIYETHLLDALTAAHRRFAKGLRYNLPSSRPLASAVLSDTAPLPTALYVVPPDCTDDYLEALGALTEDSSLGSWEWMAGEPMPALPPLG